MLSATKTKNTYLEKQELNTVKNLKWDVKLFSRKYS